MNSGLDHGAFSLKCLLSLVPLGHVLERASFLGFVCCNPVSFVTKPIKIVLEDSLQALFSADIGCLCCLIDSSSAAVLELIGSFLSFHSVLLILILG